MESVINSKTFFWISVLCVVLAVFDCLMYKQFELACGLAICAIFSLVICYWLVRDGF